MSVQNKFTLNVRGKVFFYPSMYEAMKMAQAVGARMSDIKQLH